MDQQQREQLRDIVTGLANIEGSSDAALIQLGHGACTVMGSATMHNAIKAMEDQYFSLDAAIAVSIASIRAYCPQHTHQIPTS